METYDVIIIGGGPAGAACALTFIEHYNKKVLLLERGDFTQQRIGEQVSHSIFDFLQYLHVPREAFGEACFTPNYGKESYWGSAVQSNHFSLFSSQGKTYQLDRTRFDETLLMTISERGGTIIPRAKQIHISQQENRWQVQCVHPEQGALQYQSEYLIDASGRQTKIGQALGLEPVVTDQLVGIGAFVEHPEQVFEQQQKIESCEYGWWYMAGLSKERAVVTCFTDVDIMKEKQLNRQQIWNQYLAKTSAIGAALRGCISTQPKLWVKQANSQYCSATFPEKFIAVGDALVSFDPISSMGIGFAMLSGCHGAYALMHHEKAAVHDYQRDAILTFNEYCETKWDFYQKEQRWSNHPFWQRRLIKPNQQSKAIYA